MCNPLVSGNVLDFRTTSPDVSGWRRQGSANGLKLPADASIDASGIDAPPRRTATEQFSASGPSARLNQDAENI